MVFKKGYKMSEEHKEKIRLAKKGKRPKNYEKFKEGNRKYLLKLSKERRTEAICENCHIKTDKIRGRFSIKNDC